MKLKLDSSVASLQDLRALVDELHDYSRWMAHNQAKQRVHAKGKSPAPELSEAARFCIRHYVPNSTKASAALEELVAELSELNKKAPQLTITLAAPPSPSLRRSLVEWCRTNVSQTVLVSFRYNSNLLGGMVVRAGSHLFDWSFRRKLLEQSATFPGVLRNV